MIACRRVSRPKVLDLRKTVEAFLDAAEDLEVLNGAALHYIVCVCIFLWSVRLTTKKTCRRRRRRSGEWRMHVVCDSCSEVCCSRAIESSHGAPKGLNLAGPSQAKAHSIARHFMVANKPAIAAPGVLGPKYKPVRSCANTACAIISTVPAQDALCLSDLVDEVVQ